jgi:Cu(I)/Ag(I) efflux system membrane fusion protein
LEEAEVSIPHTESAKTFREQLGGVLSAYLEIQTALAEDNDGAAAKASAAAVAALAAVEMDLLSGAAHLAWMRDFAGLQEALAEIQRAENITARRQAFLLLSSGLWGALRRFGYHGQQTVRWFHCPMANKGAGADWIQIDKTIANPYYGASMLRCGSQTDSIAAMTNRAGERSP